MRCKGELIGFYYTECDRSDDVSRLIERYDRSAYSFSILTSRGPNDTGLGILLGGSSPQEDVMMESIDLNINLVIEGMFIAW